MWFHSLLYLLLSIELILIGVYSIIQWRIKQRRTLDIYICVFTCFLGLSYFLTGLVSFPIFAIDYFKLTIDAIITFGLGGYFIRIIYSDIKKIKNLKIK